MTIRRTDKPETLRPRPMIKYLESTEQQRDELCNELQNVAVEWAKKYNISGLSTGHVNIYRGLQEAVHEAELQEHKRQHARGNKLSDDGSFWIHCTHQYELKVPYCPECDHIRQEITN